MPRSPLACPVVDTQPVNLDPAAGRPAPSHVNVTFLECSQCGQRHERGVLHNLCRACGKPLLVRYDLARAARTLERSALAGRAANLWRYRELLPVVHAANVTTLGEGWTPLLPAANLGARLGVKQLYLKDESANPTGSFKARGMAVAVAMARELGARRLAVPSAGNAAGALAAYAARAGLPATIFLPRDAPEANRVECRLSGAEVVLVDGLVDDCARLLAAGAERNGWFDVSTLKEPYRIEGKKTMGYELAEQLDWELPEVIVYPTGGGTGLIGMWKAFDELQQLGWIDSRRPRMIVVQPSGCAPIAAAFEAGANTAAAVPQPRTAAAGLRIPKPLGDFLILDIVRRSGGRALAVEDAEILAAVQELASAEGVFAAPEGAACVPALRRLRELGEVQPGDRVVLFNTGSGVKYLDLWRDRGAEPYNGDFDDSVESRRHGRHGS